MLTHKNLTDDVAARCKAERHIAAKWVRATLAVIRDYFEDGISLRLKGIGTFTVTEKKSRIRDPNTGTWSWQHVGKTEVQFEPAERKK